MCEDILQRIRQLERIDIAQTELNVRIHDELRQAKDFTTQVERVSETGLLTFLRRKRPELAVRTC